MKVLCFGRFFDDIPGGMQRHVAQLFSALSGQVEFVHLVPSRDRHASRFLSQGVPVIRTRSFNVDGSVALSPGLITEAIRLHRARRFDLVHLHFPDPMSHLASLALPAEIPRVISWHADIVRQRYLLPFYRPLQRRALRQAAAVIVATPAHLSDSPNLAEVAQSGRLHVIPYGFDFAPYLSEHAEARAIRQRFPGKIIFALGRHVYYKGFDVLIRAMQHVDADTRLIIGGIGPLTEQWKAQAAASGLGERITFVGLIDEAQLPAYYQAADVFCLPAVSPAEAFGIVQVEAMAAGRPVVSSQLNNGVNFVNRDGVSGLTVEPQDPLALAQALNRLMRDAELRQRLGEGARRRALNEFSLSAMGQKTRELYQKIAPGGMQAASHASPVRAECPVDAPILK